MNRIQQLAHNWNNAPWSARGRRFKWVVENTLILTIIIGAVLVSGAWQ